MTRRGAAESEAAQHGIAAVVGAIVDTLSNGIFVWQLYHINPPHFPGLLHRSLRAGARRAGCSDRSG
eukprot:9598693-Alexandrium_andersonii.AAC.1